MHIEKKSMDELIDFVKEKGYTSPEAEAVLKELEQSKKSYDSLIRSRGILEDHQSKAAAIVVEYYLDYLEKLRQVIPYDAMGGKFSIYKMVLHEFCKQDIAEQVSRLCGVNLFVGDDELKREIQRFITVQLDPRGIILYMDILRNQRCKRPHACTAGFCEKKMCRR